MLLNLVLFSTLAACQAADHLCAVPLKLGDKAPFTGQLLTSDLAAKLALGLEQHRVAAGVAQDKCAQDAAIDKSLCTMVQQTQLAEFVRSQKSCNQVVADCQTGLRQMELPWYKSAWFVGPLAAILSGTAVAWALHH
jgi:hypothetical protein